MKHTKRTLISRSILTLASVIACSSALAMPFCGNKGYKSGYNYMPSYAYPTMAPAYGYAPMIQPHVHSWNQAAQPMAPGVTAQPATSTAQPATPEGS